MMMMMKARSLAVLAGLIWASNCLAFIPQQQPARTRSAALAPTITVLAERRRNRSSEEDSSSNNDKKEIPQLPSFGSSSYDATAAAERKFLGDNNDNDNTPALVDRKFELQYTCKVCGTRNVHRVSRIAYHKGVVITVCKGCMSQHLISDNLGFTQQFDGNLEDYFKEQGSEESVQRVSKDVFDLEKILGVDTSSGSIFGQDGTAHME